MHYPLHITLLLASLWILQEDANAAKNTFNADVLTSFAKNIASVLSTTLLSTYQDSPSNQSSISLLKRIQEAQSSLDLGYTEPDDGSEISSKASVGRYSRNTRESSTSNDGKQAFQDAYITNPSQSSKYYHSEAYTPYKFTLNPVAQVSHGQVNAKAPVYVHTDTKDNSIETDVKAASLHYTNQYHRPSGFGHKPVLVHSLTNPNHYAQHDLQAHYHRDGTEPSSAVNANSDGNENTQAARITRGPYNLHYHGPFHASHHPPFHGHPGFYPYARPIESEGQPATSNGGLDESSPSRLVDDQNQGQSTLGGYDYGPRFNHGPSYHNGFYHGFPGFHPGPFNDSFNPGNAEQGGGNGTNGPLPYGPPFFHGPRFGPFFPYYQQPFYPNYHGHGRPVGPQNPPDQQGNPEQAATPENNGQGDVNATANRPPFGFPPYYGGPSYGGPYYGGPYYGGPYYGGINFPAYPLVPFNGLPYRFGHGLHYPLYGPRIKTVPYLNFYPTAYHHFPAVHLYPFGGYHPNSNHQPMAMMMPEKPAQAEKTVNENAESGGAPSNGEAEMLSESKPEMVRSSAPK